MLFSDWEAASLSVNPSWFVKQLLASPAESWSCSVEVLSPGLLGKRFQERGLVKQRPVPDPGLPSAYPEVSGLCRDIIAVVRKTTFSCRCHFLWLLRTPVCEQGHFLFPRHLEQADFILCLFLILGAVERVVLFYSELKPFSGGLCCPSVKILKQQLSKSWLGSIVPGKTCSFILFHFISFFVQGFSAQNGDLLSSSF